MQIEGEFPEILSIKDSVRKYVFEPNARKVRALSMLSNHTLPACTASSLQVLLAMLTRFPAKCPCAVSNKFFVVEESSSRTNTLILNPLHSFNKGLLLESPQKHALQADSVRIAVLEMRGRQ